MLQRAGKLAVRRPWLVVCCWAFVALAGALSSRGLNGLLSTSLAVPGTSSETAVQLLTAHFGADPEGSFTLVVPQTLLGASAASAGTGSSPTAVGELRRRLESALRSIPGASVGEVLAAPGLYEAAIDTPLGLQAATAATPRLRVALARAGLGRGLLTGPPALQHDLAPVLSSDLRRGELVALGAAVVVLVVVLGPGPGVLVPFAVAAATVLTVLGLLDALARVTLLVLYTPNLVELVALGLAMDYGLLMILRFGEELSATAASTPDTVARGRPGRRRFERSAVEQAVLAVTASAGRTVATSGLAVALGLGMLVLVPVPFVASLGLAGLLVPLVALLCALTLVPALLVIAGGAAVPARLGRSEASSGRPALWDRLALAVESHRSVVAVAALVVLGVLGAPLAWLRLTPVSITAIPRLGAAAAGMRELVGRAGPGSVTPIDIVLDTGARRGAARPAVIAATLRLGRELLADPAVLGVAIGTRPPYLDPSGRYEQVVVVARDDLGAPATRGLVLALRLRLLRGAGFGRGVRAVVGGAPAQGVDFLDRVYGDLPQLAGLAAAASYLLLAVALGSLVVPLVAMVLDACSLAAALGLVVLFFRFGWGARLFGLYSVARIEGWVPVVLGALLFGLSMDYEVFIVSRVRERLTKGDAPDLAVRRGLAASGRVVSAAALVMVGALAGLATGHVAGLQELGVGLALGVGVDVTVVRSLLLPVVLGWLGSAGFFMPVRLRHLVPAARGSAAARAEAPLPPVLGERGPG